MISNLFVCENPFQILVAMIIASNKGSFLQSDILLTNRSADMEERFERLLAGNVFRSAFYIHSKQCNDWSNKINYWKRQLSCEFNGCYLEELNNLKYEYTDVYSIDNRCLTNEICHRIQKNSIIPQLHLYEEGFGCYTKYYERHLLGFHHGKTLVQAISDHLNRRLKTLNLVENFMVFEPELLCWNVPFKVDKIKKPDISQAHLKKIINDVFNYEDDAKMYDKSIIFFEDCVFQNTGDNGDFPIINGLADIVGKENFILKMHPRTEVNRFIDIGINTVKKLGMPWEIIAMNMKEDNNHIFVTISSSAVVTYSLLFDKNFHSILLFKCLPRFAKNINPYLLFFLENYSKQKPEILYIPNNLEEARMKIEEWLGLGGVQ